MNAKKKGLKKPRRKQPFGGKTTSRQVARDAISKGRKTSQKHFNNSDPEPTNTAQTVKVRAKKEARYVREERLQKNNNQQQAA